MMGQWALFFAALCFVLCAGAGAQEEFSETVHGVVVFTRHGEQTPVVFPEQHKLTPLGAQQLYAAGSDIRRRYIVPSKSSLNDTTASEPILGLSAYSLDNSQVYALAPHDEHILSSAQAFFQGLYPPTNSSAIDPFVSSLSLLANNSNIGNPLNGYQYAQIQTTSASDLESIWVAGGAECDSYSKSASDYASSSEFKNADTASRALYQSLGDSSVRLRDMLSDEGLSYTNADVVYDYINYEYNHNATLKNKVSNSTLAQLQTLASQQSWALIGNLSASGASPGDRIRAIAGAALAGKVTSLLTNNVAQRGSANKLNVLFGSYEPLVGFFALSRLANPDAGEAFYGLPDFGSSMAFQLFSTGNSTTEYPSEDDLWVRFLFRNGTDAQLTPYPIFGRGHSETDMMWSDFKTEMQAIMIHYVSDWCSACQSGAVFCAAYSSTSNDTYWTSATETVLPPSGELSPTVGGIIGAMVTLAVVLMAIGAIMLFGGVRCHRVGGKRRSDLGGFKGAEKLASDADLPAGGAGAAAAVVSHERAGSWEMKNNASTGPRPDTAHTSASVGSELGDHHDPAVNPFADPVKTQDGV